MVMVDVAGSSHPLGVLKSPSQLTLSKDWWPPGNECALIKQTG